MRAQVLAQLAVQRNFGVRFPWPSMRAIADDAVAMARRVGEAHAGGGAGRRPRRPLAAWPGGGSAVGELIELTEAGAPGRMEQPRPISAARSHSLELCEPDEAELHLARYSELAERVLAALPARVHPHRRCARSRRCSLGTTKHGAAAIAREVLERG